MKVVVLFECFERSMRQHWHKNVISVMVVACSCVDGSFQMLWEESGVKDIILIFVFCPVVSMYFLSFILLRQRRCHQSLICTKVINVLLYTFFSL